MCGHRQTRPQLLHRLLRGYVSVWVCMCVMQGHFQHSTLHVNSASVTLQLPVKLRFLSAMVNGRGSCRQVQTHVEIFFLGRNASRQDQLKKYVLGWQSGSDLLIWQKFKLCRVYYCQYVPFYPLWLALFIALFSIGLSSTTCIWFLKSLHSHNLETTSTGATLSLFMQQQRGNSYLAVLV